MINDKMVELSLPNVAGYERIAMGCSETFAKHLGFDPERVEDLKTAVAEACLNAMQHGNQGKKDTRVIVSMNYVDDSFQVEVWDQGNGISEIPDDPDIDRIVKEIDPIMGFGLFLIRKLVDKVEFYKAEDKGHVVKMTVNKR